MTMNRIAASGKNEIMADMARAHITFRTWAALILLAALAWLFASLGNWQLDRAAQRDAIHKQIQDAAQLSPVQLAANTPASDLIPWRPALAQGHWLHQYTVLLQNRNYQSRPGYWVATPLQLSGSIQGSGQDGANRAPGSNASSGTAATSASGYDGVSAANGPAVLVLRGWLARDDAIHHDDNGRSRLDPALGQQLAQSGEGKTVTISGELLSHVPRLFELWTWSRNNTAQLPDQLVDTRQQLPTVQNLNLDDYEQATGLTLLPIVLAADDSEPAMVQDWPKPSSDSDTNRGYALQWFSFCAIAVGAWLFIAWRSVKKFFN